jgi:hypothetical protein
LVSEKVKVDNKMNEFNGLVSFLMFCICGWAVMAPSVRDGIIVKLGLSVLALGFLSAVFLAIDPVGRRQLAVVQAVLNVGLLIVMAGYFWRNRRLRNRRHSDRKEKL